MSQTNKSRNMKGSSSQKRSKYVSRACESCRQRRAKCDGKRPSCSLCLIKTIDCLYSTASDGRKPASKSYVQLLRDRIELLENILRSYSIDIDAAITSFRNKHLDALESELHSSNTTTAQFEEMCAAFEGTLSIEGPLNFDQDGEIHYFGPTSGRLSFRNLEDRSCDEQLFPQTEVCHMRSIGELSKSRADPYTSLLEVDATLQAELIDLYFVWQNPWFPVVDELLFRESFRRGNGRYSSPFLLTCILAAGSRSSDRPELRADLNSPTTAGKHFLGRAEDLLLHDLKAPSLATIQAVSIMVITYCAHGADAAAWLHQGTAHRLALDMGLNFDAESVSSSINMSAEETDLRRQIYWSLYCADKLHATYSGRVCTMLGSQGAVKLPFADIVGGSQCGSNVRSQRVSILLRPCVIQNQILEKILLGLYAPQPLYTGSRRHSFFDSTLLELKNWLYDLPDPLRLESGSQMNSFPQAYTLHMTFHTTLILLGNAMLASNTHSASKDFEVPSSSSQKATHVCREAARNICVTAKKYRKVFGSFRRSPISATHCLLSAALVLIQIASTESEAKRRAAAVAEVDFCLQCLDELSLPWSPAGRIHRNVTMLRSQILDQGKPSRTKADTRHIQLLGPVDPPALNAESYGNDDSFLFDAPTGHHLTTPLLLENTHSFLEAFTGEVNGAAGFDTSTGVGDTALHEPYFLGSFAMDFTTGFDIL